MISQLASPSVCVIDDEKDDYEPILEALNKLYVSNVHIPGSVDGLPPQPFGRLRLVFLDLHLSGSVGKDAASYTANVFLKVVAAETAPILVVIWSKYAGDKVVVAGLPPEDQETEVELFKRTLFEAEARYRGRLIFVEMAKPKKDERPDDWTRILKGEIETALQGQSAIDLLWAWDSLVKEGCAQVSQGLTLVAQTATAADGRELKEGLKATMQQLAKAQGEGDFSAATAPKHLLTVLTELLVDQLEHPSGIAGAAAHGAWLSENVGVVDAAFAPHMNALLLTAGADGREALYTPGTVYTIEDPQGFMGAFGMPVTSLIDGCCKRNDPHAKLIEWRAKCKPVLIELSPVCDMAHHRVSSLLVAGMIIPVGLKNEANSKDAFGALPPFRIRWPVPGFAEQDAVLAYCHRYRLTLPATVLPAWLKPWFRLRDLPVAAIRNSNAAHAARVGYVSL